MAIQVCHGGSVRCVNWDCRDRFDCRYGRDGAVSRNGRDVDVSRNGRGGRGANKVGAERKVGMGVVGTAGMVGMYECFHCSSWQALLFDDVVEAHATEYIEPERY